MPMMKALRSFRGEPGEGVDRMVHAGNEFSVASDRRAEELERIGHAVPILQIKAEPSAQKIAMPPPENKAAHAGPLPLVGGEIGAESAPSSSDQGRAQPRRSSRKPAGGFDL